MATPQLLIGKSIGRYHILEKLGAGGMGVVYRAHDERLHRIVALKLLAANIASHSEQWARILSEARAAAALNHPGITTIHEVAQEGEHIFIVMELIEGKSLRELLREGPMEPRAVTHLATQVTEALAVAHTHGVIHGDIKPENIMVSANQRIKLLDFGLARQLVEDSLTVTELATNETLRDPQLAGTLAYMAPEQFYGGPRDERTDLFSLGVVFYEMTAGRRPFHGPSATALAAQVMIDAPPCLSEEASGVPSELVRIIFKLLDKNPASRHQSAHELCVDLKNLSRDLKLGIRLPTAVANRTAVAVLPFKLLTPNPEDEYLRVALADPVINRLSACSDLLVRPINAVMRYAAQATDLMATAQELNVQILVDGSVQRFGQRLRVHVQAWNVQDGSSRLSDKYDAECI